MTPIRTALAFALATSTALTAGAASATINLKLSHFVPSAIGLQTEFMEPWARELETCSNGEVEVEIYPAGSALGNIANQFD
jgi:TRAP-type C4-dicarboxylate transport system substrate-binding protein|tara:strand:+ start:7558 stop:7800 length:243 start_codon:yes stop_codon:yes gene_type:complete